MRTLFLFNIRYFVLALLLFAVEVLIALFVHDSIIRPYVGDALVVMLIYCFVKSFLNTLVLPTAVSVLLFSFVMEGLQYVKIVNRFGLEHSTLASTVIGTSFAWTDIFAYIIGISIVLLLEKQALRSKR
ncbi:MAG: DUF2809 domain-containing protein [Bacteroidota bacterium]